MNIKINKYQRWYDQLIERALITNGPVIEKYKRKKGLERHHIVPRSCGGTDDLSNMVWFKHREHVIAHMLLPRFVITDRIDKLWYALWCMVNTNGVKVNSRLYEKIRTEAFNRRSKDSGWKVNIVAGAKKRSQDPVWRHKNKLALQKARSAQGDLKQHWRDIYKRPEYRANRVLGMMLGRKRPCSQPELRRWYKPKPCYVSREGLMAILANEEKYGSAKTDIALALLSY